MPAIIYLVLILIAAPCSLSSEWIQVYTDIKDHIIDIRFSDARNGYLLTSEGEFVDVRLNNSHWEEYQAVNPESPEDGIEVMKLMIANNW